MTISADRLTERCMYVHPDTEQVCVVTERRTESAGYVVLEGYTYHGHQAVRLSFWPSKPPMVAVPTPNHREG